MSAAQFSLYIWKQIGNLLGNGQPLCLIDHLVVKTEILHFLFLININIVVGVAWLMNK